MKKKRINRKLLIPYFFGAPRRIRTSDIQIRSLALYPAEPWAQDCYLYWRRERDLNPRYTFWGVQSLSRRSLSATQPSLRVNLFSQRSRMSRYLPIMAEGAGFEPANLSVNGFQDRRHRPLGHPSELSSACALKHATLPVRSCQSLSYTASGPRE